MLFFMWEPKGHRPGILDALGFPVRFWGFFKKPSKNPGKPTKGTILKKALQKKMPSISFA